MCASWSDSFHIWKCYCFMSGCWLIIKVIMILYRTLHGTDCGSKGTKIMRSPFEMSTDDILRHFFFFRWNQIRAVCPEWYMNNIIDSHIQGNCDLLSPLLGFINTGIIKLISTESIQWVFYRFILGIFNKWILWCHRLVLHSMQLNTSLKFKPSSSKLYASWTRNKCS